MDRAALITPPDVVTAEDWNRCLPWLEAALQYARGTHTALDVLADIEANRATFWPFERSVLVTQMIDWPQMRVFSYWLAGGDLDDLLSKEAGLVEYAKAQGAHRITIPGRPGWRRVMAPYGFSPIAEIVAKDI